MKSAGTSSSPRPRSAEDLERLQAEVMILLKAYDDTFSQTVLARYSYRYDEIGWNQQFAPAALGRRSGAAASRGDDPPQGIRRYVQPDGAGALFLPLR